MLKRFLVSILPDSVRSILSFNYLKANSITSHPEKIKRAAVQKLSAAAA